MTHPNRATAPMSDLDFMKHKIVVFKSDQVPSIVAFPRARDKSHVEVEHAVQSVHWFARTLKDFLEQQFGIALES